VLGIIGHKVGMTKIFTENGEANSVTIIKAGPCFITQIKSDEIHGYNSIQLGYFEVATKKLNKPKVGSLKKISLPNFKYLKEYPVIKNHEFELGKIINVINFKEGEFVDITGKSIGKGFTGNHKRNKFKRGPMSHGSKNHRAPGSIGQGSTPGRVFPGKKMAGRMGGHQITASNLKILKVDIKENIIIVRGSVPGKPGNLLSITLTKRL
jgi:large subunit ribosomal protein L3